MATATKAPKATASAKATVSATAPADETLDVSATATAPEATATAPAIDTGMTTPTLQEALASADTTAPVSATAESVSSAQKAIFTRIIGKAKRLANIENRTLLSMGADLQEAIDTFKTLIPKADWWRQRADTISDFERGYRLAMNGRTPRAYEWLTAFHLEALVSDEAKAILRSGLGGRPFPMTTVDALGAWVVYDKSDDSWTVKAGFEDALDTMVSRVADEGLTTAKATEAMKAIEAEHRLATAHANGGDKAKASEAKAQASKGKRDRAKALDKALDKLAESIESDTIGGASASELLNKLADRGLAEVTGLVDPSTMTPTEALAFAQSLCELDRTDVIFVILTRLRAFELNALATAKSAVPPVEPSLSATA